MSKTKEKILDKALEMFNQKGSVHVTVRHLAQELGISHGNLCYHYPNTDAIIVQLYERLVEKLNKGISQAMSPALGLTDILKFTEHIFALFYEFRFLMLEFVDIMRRIESVKKHYGTLQARRKAEFSFVFTLMQNKGYMHQEEYEGQYLMLIEQIIMMGDFWMSEGEILFQGSEEDQIKHYSKLFNNQIFPVLTEKGKKEYLHYYGLKIVTKSEE